MAIMNFFSKFDEYIFLADVDIITNQKYIPENNNIMLNIIVNLETKNAITSIVCTT